MRTSSSRRRSTTPDSAPSDAARALAWVDAALWFEAILDGLRRTPRPAGTSPARRGERWHDGRRGRAAA